ncbi:MAG: 16S rRNA (cytosine(1402)-N(4))-methyltransferase RsmH [Bacillales bacterium]
MKSNHHIPVMLKEVIEGLNIKEDGIYLDLTLGRAGHSSEILKKIPNGKLIALDQDQESINYSTDLLNKISSNFKIINTNFVNIKKVLEDLGIKEVDGALFDLGVSSPMFDEDYRGFSYRYNNKLDMRMDLNNPLTAELIVNNYSLENLYKILKNYGEDKYSYQIARNIVKEREKKPIQTTFELVEIIKNSKPAKELKSIGHPAKQTFQALRIEVNNELNVLETALEDVIKQLKVGGRIAVICFQSLEDKIVKRIFKKYSIIEGNRKNDFILPQQISLPNYKMINKKVIKASQDELDINHRSKSATLRILERIK